MRFTFALTERSDDGQIDEILGLSDNLDLLEDVVQARVMDLTEPYGDDRDCAVEATASSFDAMRETAKTPSLRYSFRPVDGMTYTVQSAPYAEGPAR